MTRLAAVLAAVLVAVLFVAALADARPARAAAAQVDNTRPMVDTLGLRVDAHDGDLVEADGAAWLFGTSYGCGFTLAVQGSPYCGVRVYRSTDLATWTPAGAVAGYAFNHLTPEVQGMCQESLGCFRPHVVRRPSDGRWVMWLNTHGGPGAQAGYRTFVADQVAGPYVLTPNRPVLAVDPADGGLEHGDMDVTVGPDGVGWAAYTVIRANPAPGQSSHYLVVERLDPSLLTGTGDRVVVTAASAGRPAVEAPGLFRAPTGTWHLIYSDPATPYGIAATGIVDAPTPLGPWTSPRNLQANSCSGQPAGVAVFRGQWVYVADRWAGPGNPNQALANTFLGRLTFNANGGTAIDYYTCQPWWTST